MVSDQGWFGALHRLSVCMLMTVCPNNPAQGSAPTGVESWGVPQTFELGWNVF